MSDKPKNVTLRRQQDRMAKQLQRYTQEPWEPVNGIQVAALAFSQALERVRVSLQKLHAEGETTCQSK